MTTQKNLINQLRNISGVSWDRVKGLYIPQEIGIESLVDSSGPPLNFYKDMSREIKKLYHDKKIFISPYQYDTTGLRI